MTTSTSVPEHDHHDHDADPHDDTVEAHYSGLERLEAPHACSGGLVFIGHFVRDPGTGEEVEVIEAVPCRRCAEEAR